MRPTETGTEEKKHEEHLVCSLLRKAQLSPIDHEEELQFFPKT